jgi:hypothetical protein
MLPDSTDRIHMLQKVLEDLKAKSTQELTEAGYHCCALISA